MKKIVVGGNFGETPKESSIIKSIANEFDCDCINGGSFEDIKNVDLSGYKLIIWAPNIENSFEKIYPKKDIGSILICSKVLRENRTEIDAISRIFQMHGNAVIAINSNNKPFTFKLLDALGNVWIDTMSIETLCETIDEFVEWTSSSVRKRCTQVKDLEHEFGDIDFSQYEEFIELNKQVADKFEENKGRYFGNTSTRCMKMFPTTKTDSTHMIVSRRNSSKKRLTTDDLVLTRFSDDGSIEYYGDNKPSVDTPIQLSLYKMFPEINYMIHGHSYIQGGEFTEHYFPCGDMREVEPCAELISENDKNYGVINLKNHGFLIYTDSIENLKNIVNKMEFSERKIGFEKVC